MRAIPQRFGKPSANQWILIGILALGGILRFSDYFHLPYSYDAFSAWFRTRFGSFAALIEEGGSSDYDAVSEQVLLSYWVMCFGDDAGVVNLRFVLAVVDSIYPAFFIAR